MFASAAATVSLSAVFGAVGLIVTYARVCARRPPGISLLYGLASWCCAAFLLTSLATLIGPSWSGMFAVFPVITIVLSVSSHRVSGPAFAATLLRAMIWGLYALTSFCFALAVLLPQRGVIVSFVAATAVALAVQWALKSRLHRR